MAQTRRLDDMLLDIRTRTNQENSTFVTDAELTGYLNVALMELWNRLFMAGGQPAHRSTSTIAVTTASGTLYPLPADFLSLQEMVLTLGGTTGTMHPFMPLERAGLLDGSVWGGLSPVLYRLQGSNVEFLPVNQSFSVQVAYTPMLPKLAVSSDTFDGFNGFEMAPIYDVCAVVLQKEESDPTFYAGQRDRLYAQIDAMAALRDASHPERVSDVRAGDAGYWIYGD